MSSHLSNLTDAGTLDWNEDPMQGQSQRSNLIDADNLDKDEDEMEDRSQRIDPFEADTLDHCLGRVEGKSHPEPVEGEGMVAQNEAQSLPKKSSMSGPGLEVIFNNPILLSSFIGNFERSDYNQLAQLAATIPSVAPWPRWDPLTQPWPQGILPFDIRDLPVRCQDSRGPARGLIPKGPPQREVTSCEWELEFGGKRCDLTEKVQGVRPRPGPNHEKAMEKAPIDFLECVGYRLELTDLSTLDVTRSLKELLTIEALSNSGILGCVESVLHSMEKDGSSSPSTLVDLHKHHSAGHMVCSKCTRENHLIGNMCLWFHERMIPLCRFCCDTPSSKQFDFRLTPKTPSIAENIRNFSSGVEHMRCDCYTAFSPENGYHLCSFCAGLLTSLVHLHFKWNRNAICPRGNGACVFEVGHPLESVGRNYCPCGNDWQALVQSWDGISQEERDKKMYRLCVFCTGHIPRSKVMTAKPTNCL